MSLIGGQTPTAQPNQWLCVPCVAESVGHDGPGPKPSVNTADMIVQGTTICVNHLKVEKRSPLQVVQGDVIPGTFGRG